MSELYQLPNGWEWTEWNKIVNIKNGKDYKDVLDINGKYPIYGSGGIINYSNQYLCNENSIIIGRKGSINNPLYVKEKFWNIDTAFGIEPKTEKIIPLLFYYYCLNYDFMQHNTATTLPSLTKSTLLNINFPLPPLSEQQRIVAKLDLLFAKIDKSIELHQKNMDETDAFMGSVLNEVFGELEEKYGLQSLSTVVKINSGIALPSIFKDVETSEGEYEFFKVAQMNNDNKVMKDAELNFTLLQSKEYKIKLFPKGSILIPKRGGAILTNKKRILERDASYDSNVMGLKADNKILTDEFLFAFLDSINLADFVDTSTIPQINNKHIDMMNISIPPLPIQQKVVDYLDTVSQKMEKVKSIQKEKMESLKALKASILDKAFRGEL